ncbi:hypothetical protein F4604DRAFT_1759118 [Suillus subluteus]|nr:hypothetical protein F4604DRAFT_1759118 [Suillus subluteus]
MQLQNRSFVSIELCAGEFFESEITDIALHDIRKEVLQPYQRHFHQNLVDGMLVHDQAVDIHKDDGRYGHLCSSCLHEVNANKTPMLSLANHLWVGDVPDELAMLTLPERILVALSYPAVYTVPVCMDATITRNTHPHSLLISRTVTHNSGWVA